jgi:dipeptidyl-peptidase 4
MTSQKTRAIIPAAVLALVVFLAPCLFSVAAPETEAPPLTLERIFASREFASERFGPARWMTDGRSYTTVEDSTDVEGGRDIVLYRTGTGGREILIPAASLVPPGESKSLAIHDYVWSADGRRLLIMTNTRRVWRQNTRGDFWVLDRESGALTRLGRDFEEARLMFAKFSPDGGRAAYVYKNDIYEEEIETGRIVRLTWDGSEDIINGTSDWVNEEEFGIRDGFRWSPDGTRIAFWRFDQSRVKDFHMINNTDDLYPRIITFKYPKAGETNSAVFLGVVPSGGGPATWIQAPGDRRNHYIARMDWLPDGTGVVFQYLNRLQNTNSLMIGDAVTGEVRTVFVDRDDAWVDVMDEFLWVKNGASLVWLSERNGWRQAFLVPRTGGEPVCLTPGAYDVISLSAVDDKGGRLYFIASPENPMQRYLHRVRLDGRGKLERLTPAGQSGTHSYALSPTAEWAFHTFTTFDTPPVVSLVKLPGHETVRVMAANAKLIEAVRSLARQTEFFRVDIGDGVLLDGWSIKPPDFDPAKKYPLFIHVYGEPAGQTVLDRWGGNNRLWHQMLAEQGYVVVSLDNRGTPAPRGREWRKCIYGQVGILASADQAAALRALLKKWPFLDPDRVGIWGWSGGGQMTLNAMFRYPELYKTGIAIAFVSHQKYYDTIYQERFMGLPRDNPEGYEQGSPLTFAQNLEGNLFIAHGTADDNVHYQAFEALVNELIAHNKPFTMMSYPNRAHGISEGPNTTLHLYSAMTRFLKESLLPGPLNPSSGGR